MKYRPLPDPRGSLATHTPDGVPLRDGAVPLRAEEMELLERSVDVWVNVWDLAQPEQLAAYQQAMDRIANRECRLLKVLEAYDPETRSFRVLLRWCKIWAELSPRLRGRLAPGRRG